jgi:nucleotide-binding universal stress UspA family protein
MAFSPHAVAAREAAVALARGAGAQPSGLRGDDDGDDPPAVLSLPREDVGRERDTPRQRREAPMAATLKRFLAGVPPHEFPITPLCQVGPPRQLIVATAEALGVALVGMGAQSTRSALEVLWGGTATAGSRHAPCAVVMVPPGEQRPLGHTSEGGHPRQALIPE